MLEGLIDRDILGEHYDEVLEALQKYQTLQQENRQRPVYPNGTTAIMMVERLEKAKAEIGKMLDYINANRL